MHHTLGSSFLTLRQPLQRRPSTHSASSPPAPEIDIRPSQEARRSSSHSYLFTRTGRTTSTVWGPGALTGKFLKHLGEKVEGLAEYLVIRSKLNQMAKMQSILLGSVRELSHEEKEEMTDQCEKLVELCIGMGYPPIFTTRAFCIILRGFQRPGRQIWTSYVADALSKRRKIEVFEIFRDCFFFLLDESIFLIEGAVDLQTLAFRCPAVAHEIAGIVSHLARKDYMSASPRILLEPSEPLSLEPGSPSNTVEDSVSVKASFSSIIIRAGFFRLVTHWVEHGLPHWDVRGKARLEEALQDVANAQIYCGDLEQHSQEAMELIRKLRGRRLLLDDVPEAEETSGLDFEISETGQFTTDDAQGLL